MKRILSILFTIICFGTFAQTRITAPIITNSLTDTTYSVTTDSLVKGGYRVLITTGQRDSIPQAERKYGMLVYVKNTDSVYQLKSVTLDNSNWYAFSLNSGTIDTTKIAYLPKNQTFTGNNIFTGTIGNSTFWGWNANGSSGHFGLGNEIQWDNLYKTTINYMWGQKGLYFPFDTIQPQWFITSRYGNGIAFHADTPYYSKGDGHFYPFAIGSGSQSLQQVTEIGNSTDKGIRITNGTDTTISLNSDGSGYLGGSDEFLKFTNNYVVIKNTYGDYLFQVDRITRNSGLGDINSDNNGTVLNVLDNDAYQTITSNANNGYTFNGGDITTQGSIKTSKGLNSQSDSTVTSLLLDSNSGQWASTTLNNGEYSTVLPGYSGYKFNFQDLGAVRTYSFPNHDCTLDNISTSTTSAGLGFVKANGTNVTFDNTNYYSSADTGRGNTNITTGYDLNKVRDSLQANINSKGNGTVTSIATGLGMSGGTITGSGTLLVDTSSTSILSRQRAASTYTQLVGNNTLSSTQTVNSSNFLSPMLTVNANYVLAGGAATITTATTTGLVAGTYTGISPTGGTGTGLVVSITVTGTTTAAVTVTTAGSGYLAGDVITVNKTSLGGSSGTVSFFISSVTSSNSNSVNNSPFRINNYPIDYNGTSTPQMTFDVLNRDGTDVNSSSKFTISQRYFASTGLNVLDISNAVGAKLIGFQHTGQVLLPVGISVSATSTFNNNAVTMGALTVSSGGIAVSNGSLSLNTAGNKINIATGTNASVGTATLASGTVTVSTTAVTASSIILLTVQETGTNNGRIRVSARTAGTSFAITSSDAGDNCVVAYQIIN